MQGIPYVMYWNNTLSCYAAAHFRNGLLSVVQRYFTYLKDLHYLVLERLELCGLSVYLPLFMDSSK